MDDLYGEGKAYPDPYNAGEWLFLFWFWFIFMLCVLMLCVCEAGAAQKFICEHLQYFKWFISSVTDFLLFPN